MTRSPPGASGKMLDTANGTSRVCGARVPLGRSVSDAGGASELRPITEGGRMYNCGPRSRPDKAPVRVPGAHHLTPLLVHNLLSRVLLAEHATRHLAHVHDVVNHKIPEAVTISCSMVV